MVSIDVLGLQTDETNEFVLDCVQVKAEKLIKNDEAMESKRRAFFPLSSILLFSMKLINKITLNLNGK